METIDNEGGFFDRGVTMPLGRERLSEMLERYAPRLPDEGEEEEAIGLAEILALIGESEERLSRLEAAVVRFDQTIERLSGRVDDAERARARTARDVMRREQEGDEAGRQERIIELIRASNEEARRRREAIQAHAGGGGPAPVPGFWF